MFSTRTAWVRTPNPLSKLLERRRRDGSPVIDLTLSNPTEAGLNYPAAAIGRALGEAGRAAYAPEPFGLAVAREAVATHYRTMGRGFDAGRILLTSGTSEAYTHLFRLLCDPGDTVLVPVPSYPLFEYLARLSGVRVKPFAFSWDGSWHLDAGTLEAAVEPGTKAIILVHPNNPTGAYLKTEEWNIVCAVARRAGLAAIVDEVFFDYPFGADGRRAGTTAGEGGCLTFTLGGISKQCGMPHLKLAWIVVGGREDESREAIGRLEVIADTYLSVGTPVQAALPSLLKIGEGIRDHITDRMRGNLAYVQQRLEVRSGCSLLPVEGGWYGVLRLPGVLTDEEWALRLLGEAGVYVHPGYFFGFPHDGYLVISLLPSPAEFRAGIDAILHAAEA